MESEGKLIVKQNVISVNGLCVCVCLNVIAHLLVSSHAIIELNKDILIWSFLGI